jgi:hypothetical protein
MTPVTKANMEQFLVELSPLPELMGKLSDELVELRKGRLQDREMLIRTEEMLKGVTAQVQVISTSNLDLVKCAAENKTKIAVHESRLDSLVKVIWGIGIPVLLMLVKVAFDVFVKGKI